METCQYHPLKPAKFYCEHCGKHTCEQCVCEPSQQAQYNDTSYPSCFICRGEVELIDTSSSMKPFWRRLDAMHLYPFNVSGITLILLTAFLTAYSIKINLLLLIIPTAIFYNYCFSCLRTTAQGELKAPSFIDSFSVSIKILLSLLGLFILLGILMTVVAKLLGPTASFIAFGLALIAMPAIFIKLAIDESLVEALSIPSILSIIRVCGISYILLLLFIFILMGSMSYLSSMVINPEELDENNWFMPMVISGVISNYFVIVIFHIMGYLVLQNAKDLGFSSHHGEIDIKKRSNNKLLEANAEVFAKEGRYQAATEIINRLVKANPNNLQYSHKYFTLIKETRNENAINKFLSSYWQKLIDNGQENALLNSYVGIRPFMKNYAPSDTTLGLHVANIFYQNSEYVAAVKLLKSLAKNNSDDDEHLSEVFQLTAKAMIKIPEVAHQAKAYALMAKKTAKAIT